MRLRISRLPLLRWLSPGQSWRDAALELGVLAIAAQLLGFGAAIALDAPITGKRLLLKSTPKLVLLAKDAAIDITGLDPRCPAPDSSLTMDDGVNTATLVLPCGNWIANSVETLYSFRNPSAPAGPSVVKLAKVRAGYFKVVGSDLGGLPIPNGAATIDVVLNLAGITRRYCMTFTGTGDGSKLVTKDAPAGSCPAPPPCDATTGGFCWFLGGDDASCDVTCAIAARTYDSATETYAGSGGSDANCTAVLDDLGVPAGPLLTSAACFDGLGCFYNFAGRGRCSSPSTNSTSSGNFQRVCACQ